jgi:putative nucleotidyltransferase with HDIG domain
MGLAAFALIFGYDNAGLLGVLTVLVPLLILRYSQGQYIRRTSQNVGQLRATNAELNQRAQEITALNEELLLTLAGMIDLRDPYVLDHSQHVARYAALIGQQLGLSPARLELLRKAALLHDLGKIGIPERVLFKAASLDPDEYRIIQQHVTLGGDILETSHSLRPLMSFIRHHHERYDGGGYPDHLVGDNIPLEARILSLADAIEAMASDRPYRVGSTLDVIVAEIRQHSGAQFDPRVVEAFMAVVGELGEAVIINSARSLDRAAADRSPALLYPEFPLNPTPPAAAAAGQ